MTLISNSPRESVALQLEARKSFALRVLLMDAHRNRIDVSGSTFRLSCGTIDRAGTPTEAFTATGQIVDPEQGHVLFELQAAQLDLPPVQHHFSVIMVTGGYSSVLFKGVFDMQQNTEFASTEEEFDVSNPSRALSVVLGRSSEIHLELGHILPEDTIRIPAGGLTGQTLQKTGNGPYQLEWAFFDTALYANDVPALHAPLAQGNDLWEWARVLVPADLIPLQQSIDQLELDVTAAQSSANAAAASAATANSAAGTAQLTADDAAADALFALSAAGVADSKAVDALAGVEANRLKTRHIDESPTTAVIDMGGRARQDGTAVAGGARIRFNGDNSGENQFLQFLFGASVVGGITPNGSLSLSKMPWAMAAGWANIASTGITSVTFPAGRFTTTWEVAFIAIPLKHSNVCVAHIGTVTGTSAQCRLFTISGGQTGGVIHWIAVQMRSSSPWG